MIKYRAKKRQQQKQEFSVNFYNKLDLCKLNVNEASLEIFSFGKLKDNRIQKKKN